MFVHCTLIENRVLNNPDLLLQEEKKLVIGIYTDQIWCTAIK